MTTMSMNNDNQDDDGDDVSLVSKLIGSLTYARQANEAISSRERQISHLLAQNKCPNEGWDDMTIEVLMQRLAMMDSNNFISNCGVGEREARCASDLVARRHFRMGHGIGRSGEIGEVQPKAAGSSLMARLANSFVLDILRSAGVKSTQSCLIVPMATGMSLVLCMSAFRQTRQNARYVIWPRIDQKSCLKSIITAGFIPVVIECVPEENGDGLVTDVAEIERQMQLLGKENILCVLSTTSCFAPRHPDNLECISRLCASHDIPHLVNNAYGVQSSKCMHLIEQSFKTGRIDAYVQSTDKNFMVPVGGSIIAGFDKQLMKSISTTYPGRGSATPSMDMLITLLHLGMNGYHQLLKERKENLALLKEELECVAKRHGERVLNTRHNHISIAITLDTFSHLPGSETQIGSMLFMRGVSGTRVVKCDLSGNSKNAIAGHSFTNWGSHCNNYPHNYLTAAASIGITKLDIERFIKRLDQVLVKIKNKTNVKENGLDS